MSTLHPSHTRTTSPRRWIGAIALGLFATAGLLAQQAVPAVDVSAKVGAGVYELVHSPTTGEIYVASTNATAPNTPKISVLDSTTLAVKRTIDVSEAPAYGLGLNDRTHTLYTSNTRVGSVSAIDVRTGKVLSTITDPATPRAHLFRVLVDEDANLVYVSVAGTPGQVWVIDGKTNSLSHILQDTGTRPTGLALDRAANRLFVASLGSNEIVVVDLATRAVVAKHAAGGERPTQLAFDPATSRLYATNQTTGAMTVLDMKTGALVGTVKTGQQALGIGFHAPSKRVFVANRGAGTVTVIDAASLAIITELKAGTLPNTVAIDERTGTVFVTNKARAPEGGTIADDEAGDTVTRIKQ